MICCCMYILGFLLLAKPKDPLELSGCHFRLLTDQASSLGKGIKNLKDATHSFTFYENKIYLFRRNFVIL